jgi:uncharacterized repeat protein (TIGR01451 family)/fimbrial isopeptide formation D2 family protein
MSNSFARVAALTAALTLLITTAASADRAFTPRFSTNDTGQITGIANSLMTCPPSGACTAARASAAGTTGNNALDNGNFNMGFIDVDGDLSTFNSSSATLSLPAGSTVLFAGLYWGGDTSGATAAPNAAARNIVKFKAPGDALYTSLTATTLDVSTVAGRYQGFVDVTSQVAAAGNGPYTVADVQSARGTDQYAGWSLVIAYSNPAEPVRNLTVFDGLSSISQGAPVDIPVSGFLTPPTGPVRTDVGFVVWEGDNGIIGDSASLNGTTLSDAQHPANNFFDGHISTDGVNFTAKNPNDANQQGMDALFTNADGILANSATSATIRVTSTGDVYQPGVITFATEIFAPDITQTKSVADDNGGDVQAGDTLTYTIAGTNNGDDGTAGYVLNDPIPANATYVTGSLRVNPTAGSAPPAVTDAAGDDVGEFDSGSNEIVARLGTGANATNGGNVQPGASYVVTFQVVVDDPVAPGTVIENTATATYSTQTTGTPLTTPSTASSTVVAAPEADVSITKSAPAGPLSPGDALVYTLTASNAGPDTAHGVVVEDVLPAGVTFVSAPGCTYAGSTRTVTCGGFDLASGDDRTFTITTTVDAGAPASITNSATVDADEPDPDPGDNTGTSTTTVSADADLEISKTADDDTPLPGQTVTYTLTVTNHGPAGATDVLATDTLPPGVTFVSADPDCTRSGATVTCDAGDLADGESRSFDIAVKVDAVGGPFNANNKHFTNVSKLEEQISLNRGETRTVSVTCASGVVTDGSFRIDQVDQGTGTFASVRALENRQIGDRTWRVTLRNDATGRAQAKIFAVCMAPDVHPIVLSAPVTTTQALGPGTHTVDLPCGPGQVAIAPGFLFAGGDARVRRSEDDGTGWSFTVDVPVATTATLSIRCMDTQLGVVNGHTHNLQLSHPQTTATIPAGQTVEVQVTCAADAKGIVATSDLAAGLINLGNDPRPKTRAFRIYNPTGAALSATLDLLCVGDRTGGEVAPRRTIDNLATVSGTSPDGDAANNSSTARIVVG